MGRRGLTPEQRLQRAIAGGRRMALSGDRPTYHLRRVQDGYQLIELEQLVSETNPARAVEVATALLSELLDVPVGTFDVEIERPA